MATYIVLVVLPLLALGVVLKGGRSLTAAPSINGAWKFTVDSKQLSQLPCSVIVSNFQKGAVRLSQSGKSFSVVLENDALLSSRGVIEGNTLKASLRPKARSDLTCNESGQFNFEAVLDPAAHPRSMTGTLAARDCASCWSVQFHAVMVLPAAASGLN